MHAWLQHLRDLQDKVTAEAADLDKLQTKIKEPGSNRKMPVVRGKDPNALPSSVTGLFGMQLPEMTVLIQQYIQIMKNHTFQAKEGATKLGGRFTQAAVPEQVTAWMEQVVAINLTVCSHSCMNYASVKKQFSYQHLWLLSCVALVRHNTLC